MHSRVIRQTEERPTAAPVAHPLCAKLTRRTVTRSAVYFTTTRLGGNNYLLEPFLTPFCYLLSLRQTNGSGYFRC